MLSGCAQQVLAPEINRYTIELLTHCGAEVLIPEKQGCCGALSWHNGNANQAKHLAERNLTAFPDDVDWIVTNAAGCGSGMQEYGLIFSGTKHAERAERLSKKVIDVSVLLEKLQFEKRISQPDSGASVKVAYHDACHLSNGQNVTSQPRRLLKAIANLELVEIPNSEICCVSLPRCPPLLVSYCCPRKLQETDQQSLQRESGKFKPFSLSPEKSNIAECSSLRGSCS